MTMSEDDSLSEQLAENIPVDTLLRPYETQAFAAEDIRRRNSFDNCEPNRMTAIVYHCKSFRILTLCFPLNLSIRTSTAPLIQ